MTSRNSIANRQSIASSKNASRSCNQAYGLIATSMRAAPCVVQGTIERSDLTEMVVEEDGRYLVRSPKFAHRYYLVMRSGNDWTTSSREEKFQSYLIAQVERSGKHGQAA